MAAIQRPHAARPVHNDALLETTTNAPVFPARTGAGYNARQALTGQNPVRGVLTENQSWAVAVCWASRRSCGVANNLVLRKELANAYLRSAMLPATTLAQRRGRLAPRTSSVAS